jgi:hypothetical protein
VTQFHITCWAPDGQCSNLRSIVDVVEDIAKVQRRTGNKPIFVHCWYRMTNHRYMNAFSDWRGREYKVIYAWHVKL